MVTDPKAWLAPECVSDDEVKNLVNELDESTKLSVHGMARIAYCETGATGLVFANGFARQVSPSQLESFQNICKFRTATRDALCADGDPGLLYWLLTSGVFDLTRQNG